MKRLLTILLIMNFILGLFMGLLINDILFNSAEEPVNLNFNNKEKLSSYNHINENQIKVQDGKIEIDFDGRKLSWSRYTGSNSMDGILDDGHNGLEFVPESKEDIHEGDIIAFKYDDRLIVHRVIEVGNDEYGWYAVTKGDNNLQADPGKRRFEDVKFVTFGVIY
ncbi:MAG: hypothetical protein AABY07_11220 [Nanoarchaeota archaeon]